MLVAFSMFGSPDEILAVPIEKLASIRIGARHIIGIEFARKLHELAKQAPVRKVNPGTSMIIKFTANRILDLTGQIKQLDEQIVITLEQYFPNNVLKSVPGLGPVSIAAIIGEVGDINRFETVEQFIGYIGLYPVVWESGETKATFKMTFKGNKLLKTTFLVASAAARLFNPVINEYYNRLRARGKSKKAAGGAIARKLAEITFTLLKREEEWDLEKALDGMKKGQAMSASLLLKEEKGNRSLIAV